jgi:(p)ppGpp synthase/HD superfamily hydrolase
VNILEKAKNYAIKCHRETNHTYGDKPYEYHLGMVADFGEQFISLIPEEERLHVLAGCWVHDCMEDCRQTYNDVKSATDEKVAELSYALTNEKGKTRKERANDTYYKGIRETPYATFIKLCDRLANSQHSKDNNPRMLAKYTNENPDFIKELYDEKYKPMIEELEDILG